jgi:hypothetical protein
LDAVDRLQRRDKRSASQSQICAQVDLVQTGGGANGLTNLGDVRRLKRVIDVIRNRAAARLGVMDRLAVFSDIFFPTNRPAELPAYFTGKA